MLFILLKRGVLDSKFLFFGSIYAVVYNNQRLLSPSSETLYAGSVLVRWLRRFDPVS